MTRNLWPSFSFLTLLSILFLTTGSVEYAQPVTHDRSSDAIRIGLSPLQTTSSTSPMLDSQELAFLTLINNYRAQNGAGPLQVSIALENSSRWMSNDMATNNYGSHTDSLGRDPYTRLSAFNYPYYPWGENIAGGFTDAQSVFNSWATYCDADASGSCTYAHRVNMLNPRFVVIGIARAYSSTSTYGWYWTTDFGGYLDPTLTTTTTPTSVPTLTSFTASPSTITAGQSAVLSWSVSGAVTVALDNGLGDVSSVTSKSVSPTHTTSYTLTATNSAGNTTATATVIVTPASDTTPPTAPTNVTALAKSATEIDLAWTASVDNIGVIAYKLFRNGITLATLSGQSLAYADTSVSPNTTYSYFLQAYDAAGNSSSQSNSVQVTTPALQVSTSCPAPATQAFTGCYYNNTTLTGNPVFIRTDSQLNFAWGSSAPDKSLSAGYFSVRWQGNFTFSPGTYTFSIITSNGIRVYIDGVISFDRWLDQSPSIYRLQRTLNQGTHLITVEHYDDSTMATVVLSWQNNSPVVQSAPSIASFSAAPSTITSGQRTTLSWSVSGANSVSVDNGVGDVSNVTSTSVSPTSTTTYTLTAINGGGSVTARAMVTVNTSVDTQPPTVPTNVSAVANSSTEVDLSWTASTDNVGVSGYQVIRNGIVIASVTGASYYSDTTASSNTTYTYFIKAYDAAGNYSSPSSSVVVTTPTMIVAGICPAPATNAFTGCYYNNINLTGNPVFVRTDSQINFYWGSGSPDSSLAGGNFSIRWQGTFSFEQGNYTFSAITSDGMRIYIDGTAILDRWVGESPYMYTVLQPVTQGSHLITVEYYEQNLAATASVSWRRN